MAPRGAALSLETLQRHTRVDITSGDFTHATGPYADMSCSIGKLRTPRGNL